MNDRQLPRIAPIRLDPSPRRFRFFSVKPNKKEMTGLASYVKSGAIRPFVDIVYPLSDIAAAHRVGTLNSPLFGRSTGVVSNFSSSTANRIISLQAYFHF